MVTTIVAAIVHFQVYANDIHNPDTLKWSPYHGISIWEISQGRWALSIISILRGGAVVPVITTLISIILTGITSIMLIELLNIKKPLYIVIISFFMAVSPTFATTLTYTYCSDAYTLAMLLSVITVYLIYKSDKKIYSIISILLVTFVMGLYQPYLGVIVGLCIIIPILDLLKNEKGTKEIWIKILKSIGIVIVGCLMYAVISQISLKIFNTEVASYKGANSIGIGTLKKLPQSIVKAYKQFLSFFFENGILKNAYWKRGYFNIIFFVVSGISVVMLIIKNKLYKNKVRLAMLVVFLAILPIGINIILLIAADANMKLLMSASIYLPYIVLFAVFEMLNKNILKEILLKWLGVIVCFIIIVTYILSDQCTYLARWYAYNQAYSTMIRIIDRIEITEGYSNDIEWCFAGIIENEETEMTSMIYTMNIADIAEGNEFWSTYSAGNQTMKAFISKYIGIDVTWCSDEEYLEIINSEEFEEMNIFPEENSVKVINDIMVVKLQSTPVEP